MKERGRGRRWAFNAAGYVPAICNFPAEDSTRLASPANGRETRLTWLLFNWFLSMPKMHYPAGYGLNFYRARSLNFKLREWKKWNSLSVAPGTQAKLTNELSHGGAVCLAAAAAALGTGSQFDVTLAQLAFKAKTMLISSGFHPPTLWKWIHFRSRKKEEGATVVKICWRAQIVVDFYSHNYTEGIPPSPSPSALWLLTCSQLRQVERTLELALQLRLLDNAPCSG